MKRVTWIIGTLLTGTLLASSVAMAEPNHHSGGYSHNNVGVNIAQLEQRIERNALSGELTRSEERSLRQELGGLCTQRCGWGHCPRTANG